MPIKRGTNNILKIFRGTTEIDKVYRGTDLIYTSSFDPLSISNLYLYYDASQITGLSNNESVQTWSDLSGGSRNLTQATSTRRPTYKTNQRNGLPVVSFDGTDDLLRTASFSSAISQPVTIFMMYRFNTSKNVTTEQTFDDINCGVGQFTHYKLSNNGSGIFAGSPGFLLEDPAPFPTTNWTYQTFRFNTSASEIRRNGVQVASGATGSNNLSGLTLGDGCVPNAPAAIDVGEFLFYNKNLTSQETADVENYLKQKWGF